MYFVPPSGMAAVLLPWGMWVVVVPSFLLGNLFSALAFGLNRLKLFISPLSPLPLCLSFLHLPPSSLLPLPPFFSPLPPPPSFPQPCPLMNSTRVCFLWRAPLMSTFSMEWVSYTSITIPTNGECHWMRAFLSEGTSMLVWNDCVLLQLL